jgi:hypothetical protein
MDMVRIMGWFAIAAILGFLLFWAWPLVLPHPAVDDGAQSPRGVRPEAWLAVGAALALLVGLILWICFVERSSNLKDALAAIGHGVVARLLLGAVLGFGLGYALSRGLSTRADVIWLALAVTILAIISPNLDSWLYRISSFKSKVFELNLAGVELQLTGNMIHKVKIAESTEATAGVFTLSQLADYDKRIGQDIEYVEQIEMAELVARGTKDFATFSEIKTKKKYLTSAKELRYVFHELISRLAECFQNATDNGLSVQRIREVMVPPTQILQQIIANPGDGELGSRERHDAFWKAILATPEQIDRMRVSPKQKKCTEIAAKYKSRHPDLSNETAYPSIAAYADLPYLYVAAAKLMRFVNDTDIALQILENASAKVNWKDYRFNSLIAEYGYHQGRPAYLTARPLEKMRDMAVQRRRKLANHCALMPLCDTMKLSIIAELQKRDRLAEVSAMNNLVYRIAEDQARGVSSAKDLHGTVLKYVVELKAISEKNDDGFAEGELSAIKDTFAYATIVMEAQKTRPDVKIFKDMARVFQDVLDALDKTPEASRNRAFYVEQGIVRTHLRSAIELAGE